MPSIAPSRLKGENEPTHSICEVVAYSARNTSINNRGKYKDV